MASTQSELAPRVHILEPLVAERIAAGEVIERPSSVVKELVENSLDAGATEVTVLLEEGGKRLIEVLDNGHGIHRDDLKVCIQRHATSKLSSLEDLERISTLGFRGEALPSVGAVADLTILSRARGEDTAYQLHLHSLQASPEPEAVTFGHFMSSPHGTRIQARGLFSQVPARLKFLKSQASEVSQVREWIERLALAHPETGFRLVSDGRQVLSLRPQDEVGRVKAILSDGDDYPIITASNDLGLKDSGKGILQVRAHWLQGLSSPQTRKVVQVVNGRSVRDRMVQQAILAAFRQALLPGQFPAVAVFIDIDPSEIDVNVHPTKTEIRFLDSRKVFHAIESLLSSMIEKRGAPAVVATSSGASNPWASQGAAFGSSSSFGGSAPHQWSPQPSGYRPTWQASEAMPKSQTPFDFTTPPTMPVSNPGGSGFELGLNSGMGRSETAPTTSTQAYAPSTQTAGQALGLTPERFMGTAFNTYLFYDVGHELVLIDQHAAHERIRYEKLKKRALDVAKASGPDAPAGASVVSGAGVQALLIPEAVRFASDERMKVESRLDWLMALGFDAEIFGEDTLLFRAIPGEWGAHELRTRLKSLTERLIAAEASENQPLQSIFMDETLFEKLASEACHSAIRAGDRLERVEALELIEQLFTCEHPWNCPHGRPTVARIPKGKVEEWFQRRV
ncbi:MAG: DNA mismatch repair endonuclease MutL [Bdellovibrionia bacterium]